MREAQSIVSSRWLLLKVISLPHQPLQARPVEDVVGEFFVGEHGKGGALGAGAEFRGFFDGEVRVLANDRHHHADHDLQATDLLSFLLDFVTLRTFQVSTPGVPRDFPALLLS
jgi:hypothetical protein